MKSLLILLALSAAPGFEEAILTLSGASCIEELSEEEIQRYQSLSEHPVDLNLAGRSRLLATGLLTPFQAASLLEERSRSGAILSWSELALVDGFSPELAEALRHFAVLGTGHAPPGQAENRRISGSATLRGSLRDDRSLVWGAKAEVAIGERGVAYYSRRTTRDSPQAAGSFSAAYYGSRALGQLIVGAFQARFGQGLALWSGFSLSGYNSVSAFRRNGTGLSPTGSYTPSLNGIATDWNIGRWRLSAAYSIPNRVPIVNLTRSWRTLTAGLTATSEAASVELRGSLPDWSLFGEAALSRQGRFTALGGAVWVPEYGCKAALMGRWLGSGKEYSGIAAGYASPTFEATLDVARRVDNGTSRYKTVIQWKPAYEWRGAAWKPALRLSGKLQRAEKLSFRIELRGSLTLEYGPWTLQGRYDAVWGRGFAWQWYAEAGRKTEALACYLRAGIFKVDDWDDRIYVYERDAPGSFTVPARYGRGWDASFYGAWHITKSHSLWLRLETVQYPWALAAKPGRTELRMQYRYRF